ncbi:MAG: PEGA domain-containing protein [Myxococcales bacterium]|nr:PEGA domain-containing protein [Myxococcales bacterium]
MADLNSSPSNEKPNLDVLFPDLKKTDTALPAPRFMAPAAAAATLLRGAPPSARAVPPPPSLRSTKPASQRPPPPSARAVSAEREDIAEEVHADELIASSATNLEPIRPVDDDDDDSVDESPTIAMASPLSSSPRLSQPFASAPRSPIPSPPPSRRAAPPPSAAKLPPLPSAPQLARPSTPSAAKLPPMPTPPSSVKNVAPAPSPLPPVYTEGEAESMAAPPSRARAARVSAAASLAAGSSSSTAYVPPSVLPPASRPMAAQDTIQASRAHSLMPTAASVPPPAFEAPQKKSRAGAVAAVAVLSLGLLGGLGFAAVKGGSALGIGAPATGAVAITIAGPGGASVDGVRVLVDGAVKCESAPCKLTNLSAGTHFVSAEAPGFATTAARAISVERGGDAVLHIDLSPNARAAAATPAPAAKPEAQPTPVTELRTEDSAPRSAPVAAKADKAERTAKADKKDAKKDDAKKAVADDAAGQGTLNINSIPVANVVLDGRPVGSTPLVGLKVSAGPHSVVFIHPEQGRKASGTTVKAGATSTVAVRF